ncbi:type I restriction enzyme S subunit [Labrenzia sp. EL_126]|nr:type I restriction enzyme S subunit [Labrenzia sp. EL_126]
MVMAEALQIIEPEGGFGQDRVPDGYKLTEVGVIPKDWKTIKLGEVCDFQNGVNADAKSYGKGIRFANVLEVLTLSHLTSSDVPGLVTLRPNQLKTYLVKRGDILFNRTSETLEEIALASVYLDEEPIVFGGFVIRGRPKAPIFDPSYCGYAWRAAGVRSQIIAKGQGAVRANIGQSDLRTIVVPMPPKEEQEAIAEALSDQDALISNLEQLIEKKRAIKQGAMQELLSCERRLPGFDDEWKTTPIGECLTICHGRSQKNVQADNGAYPILASGGQIGSANHFLYDKPSVLIGRKGTIDRPQYVDRPFWTVDTLFYSQMNGANCAMFFYYVFQLIDWYRYNEASGVPSLNAQTIEKIEIKIPKPDEQIAIVKVLSELDDEIDALVARHSKARQIKTGMMESLLTGKVRLA